VYGTIFFMKSLIFGQRAWAGGTKSRRVRWAWIIVILQPRCSAADAICFISSICKHVTSRREEVALTLNVVVLSEETLCK